MKAALRIFASLIVFSFLAMPLTHASQASDLLQTDENIDVTFYHIALDIDIENKTISGDVNIELKSLIDNLTEVKLNLHEALALTAVGENASSFSREGNILSLVLDKSYNEGEPVSISISYGGVPPLAPGGTFGKGFRFDTHSDGIPAIATYSTPYLSHYWFPCKDGPSDKANSVWLDITIPEATYEGYELKAISNGVLTETTTEGGKKTFKWRHNHPIVPYYIMVAVSNYVHISSTYNNTTNGNSFPLDYYVFPYHQEEVMLNNVPTAFDTFISLFGDYPFKNEKFGFTQVAQNWSIENQTNPILGGMSAGWEVSMLHELSHAWFGNSITNQSWKHIWLSEGFATYASALFYEAAVGKARYMQHLSSLSSRYVDDRSLILDDDSDYNTIFHTIYFHKGAWVLHMLRGYLGDAVALNCIKSFAESTEFKYGHATTEDFIAHCTTVSGLDLTTFFEQWVYGKGYPEYHYEFYSDSERGKGGLTLSQVQSDLDASRREVFEMYIELKFHFQDGTSSTQRVFNNLKAQTFEFDFTKKIVKVEIDPNNWILRQNTISNSAELIGFDIPDQTNSLIDRENMTITVSMPYGTDISALVPSIILIDDKASVSPESGLAQDFSAGDLFYTVSAESGTVKENWTVKLILDPSTGLDEASSSKASLYPNPTSGLVKLRAASPLRTIDIYTIEGLLVNSLIYDDASEATIDLARYANRMLIIKAMFSDQSSSVFKVVVKTNN